MRERREEREKEGEEVARRRELTCLAFQPITLPK
jgi:hypothetical protein